MLLSCCIALSSQATVPELAVDFFTVRPPTPGGKMRPPQCSCLPLSTATYCNYAVSDMPIHGTNVPRIDKSMMIGDHGDSMGTLKQGSAAIVVGADWLITV
jgi:hypothetical protein